MVPRCIGYYFIDCFSISQLLDGAKLLEYLLM
ncbi:MAG: hypothetical protein GAK29_00087 [Acinetobacter bereziniae]|jgi:hypothetical protein|uniref:Uncharacterized protein n=1 Tax=Acinetobacter bereziniae TaxID=106648 RepID=A0A833UUI2_ACIBZ|nr:MAG: hypothetical protein GAK29_00087 [Acinetobacter bereziniae]